MSDVALLTLNAGSSSIKFALFALYNETVAETPLLHGHVDAIGGSAKLSVRRQAGDAERTELGADVDHAQAFDAVFETLSDHATPVVCVGHRVVHGGANFHAPVRIDEAVFARLDALAPLAPGHQPHNLHGVSAARKAWPNAPQVACFDTAFHRTQPRVAELFALPRAYAERGVLRYGFHGLSYEYIAQTAPQVLGDAPHGRMIVAHLGHGVSLCALKDGRSIATTMGFTALDGMPMGRRCGDMDAGVLLHLLQQEGMSVEDVSQLLYKQSGLLGLSGLSDDMRDLEASDAPAAQEAIAYFVYRLTREIGALTAALGGLDALVFTAGIGENSARIRGAALRALGWLGFTLDEDANAQNATRLTTPASKTSAWVIPTNEELMIARHAARVSADATASA